jgi:hypothetical protein
MNQEPQAIEPRVTQPGTRIREMIAKEIEVESHSCATDDYPEINSYIDKGP